MFVEYVLLKAKLAALDRKIITLYGYLRHIKISDREFSVTQKQLQVCNDQELEQSAHKSRPQNQKREINKITNSLNNGCQVGWKIHMDFFFRKSFFS